MSAPAANDVVSFKDREPADRAKPHNDFLVIELTIQDIDVARVLPDARPILYTKAPSKEWRSICAPLRKDPARYS
ncbi:hypothetical protein DY000_02053618 [Brassica cretica]|uniref:Uncharacterized protein n=1 Tax=Brassica cretica TaxID=69181 RepID=A0ABQ7AFP9_BRACR|nr:hypothetical protein DY000_02053618 [Brassica cretica]